MKTGRTIAMADYRLFFLDSRGAIQAREEFVAPNDEIAYRISACLSDACSDRSFGYMLWRGTVQLFRADAQSADLVDGSTAAQLDQETQRRVLQLEETIQRSKWSIARSVKLLERTAQLRESLGRADEADV